MINCENYEEALHSDCQCCDAQNCEYRKGGGKVLVYMLLLLSIGTVSIYLLLELIGKLYQYFI